MLRKIILILVILIPTIVFAQPETTKLKEKAYASADRIESKCIEWRRDFHEHPELGNNEKRTAAIVAALSIFLQSLR